MASPNLSEIISTTLQNYAPTFADNVSKGNAILLMTKKKGGWKPATGRTILQQLTYAESTSQWYSGYEVLNITPTDMLTSAEFSWKQYESNVSISGLEQDVQNVGKEAVHDLLRARIKASEMTSKNDVANAMYSDGTGSGGKEIGGLQLLVADTPTSGSVGGIDRLNYTFWRNQSYDATTDGGAPASAANIQRYMNQVFLRCSRGTDKPDLIIADRNYFSLFWESMQAIQRVTNGDSALAGFSTLAYANNVPVVYEDATGMPSNHMYFLNTDYIFFRYAPERLFAPKKGMRPVNQDSETHFVFFAGNMTLSNAMLQGVLKD